MTFPFNPAYGLDDGTRAAAVSAADLFGVAAAADMFNVSKTSVYRWRALAKREGQDRA